MDPKASDDKAGNILICTRANPKAWQPPIPGSMIDFCDRCEEPIWIAPSGVKMKETLSLTPRCMECVNEEADLSRIPIQIRPEQVDEIVAAYKRGMN